MPEKPAIREFTKGLIKQNGVFVLAVGLCPTLAVTTGLKNAAAMGIAVITVLTCSNFIISVLRKLIPREVRIPCFIVVIASFVTMIEIVFKAFLPPEVNAALGIFIPLIVVNCLILHRAESFAYKNSISRSVLDGMGAGVGFALAICLVATVREALGSGTVWGFPWMPDASPVEYVPASILIQAPGAFLVLGLLLAAFNWLRSPKPEL
ncbi:MAG: electron transport complex subunit RsxE [Planctomycetes bacterium]|nr:electron transport complex subunit RsxE [Planctomycetota bacterium]